MTTTLVLGSQYSASSLRDCEHLPRLLARLQHDQVRRRRRLVELDRRRRSAHVDLEMGLGHAAVLAGALDRLGDAFRLAERLDRDARHRPQRLQGCDLLCRRLAFGRGCRKPDLSCCPYPKLRPDSEVDVLSEVGIPRPGSRRSRCSRLAASIGVCLRGPSRSAGLAICAATLF